MKTKKNDVLICAAICLSLVLTGCGTGSATVVESTIDNFGSVMSTTDMATSEPQEGQVEIAMENEAVANSEQGVPIRNVTENAEDKTEPVEIDEYPSSEDILACIDAGESKLYWCAETPDYSGTMDIQPVATLDENNFTSELSEALGDRYVVSENSESPSAITITPEETDSDVETILSALSQLTGTEYAEIDPEEIYMAQYVPELNGYPTDAEGFFYDGDRAGEGVLGSYVGVFENGEIVIHNPLILSGTATAIDTSTLVTPETVATICRGYYENYGLPSTVVVTDITLGYYYSDSEESLLPAWQCETTLYMSENGHSDSVLLDAQTGELLRK